MARETYVLRAGRLIPKGEAEPLRPRGPASGLARPFVVSDCCEFVSMASGKVVTSKAAYRADLRSRGLVEVGNESLKGERPDVRPSGIKADLQRTISELSA